MLQLKQVVKSFAEPGGGRMTILDIERLELAAGEQMALIGRSGCGKTTLLHVISGIIRPDAGSVQIGDHDVTKMAESVRDRFRARNIGYVFQTFNLLPGFSALENVMLGMSFGGARSDAARAKSLLERVGLGHRLRHKPPMMSVGEQQRVAVARSLANRPKLLLADEPTANVDPAHQQQIVDLLRDACREEQVSLLIVTHTPEVSGQFERVQDLMEINKAAAVVSA